MRKLSKYVDRGDAVEAFEALHAKIEAEVGPAVDYDGDSIAFLKTLSLVKQVRELSSKVIHDDGESAVLRVTIRAPNELAARWYTGNFYHSTHCQHSYDCCGHWYQSTPILKKAKRREWVIYSGRHLNI